MPQQTLQWNPEAPIRGASAWLLAVREFALQGPPASLLHLPAHDVTADVYTGPASLFMTVRWRGRKGALLFRTSYCPDSAYRIMSQTRLEHGAGAPFAFVVRSSHRLERAPFLVYCDDPLFDLTEADGAIQAFSESLRKWLGQEGIRVSLIEPGSVGTNLQEEPPDVEKQLQDQAEGQQLEAEDIAYAVLYVLTNPSRSNVLQLDVAPTKQPI